MRYTICGLVAALACLAPAAQAQVHKCITPGGKTVYSDQPCDSRSVGGLIERQRTQKEIYNERVQAYEAEERKQQRYAAEHEREIAEAQRQQYYQQTAPVVQPGRSGWAERNAQRNREVSSSSITKDGGRWDQAAQAERARQAAAREQRAPTPMPAMPEEDKDNQPYTSHLTDCSGRWCHDASGHSYTRSGSFLNRSDGKTCKNVGGWASCN